MSPLAFLLRVLLPPLLFAASAAAQVRLEFCFSCSRASFIRVLPWKNGYPLIVGNGFVFNRNQQTPIMGLATLFYEPIIPPGGSGGDVLGDAGIDPAGNIWMVGTTNSDDFYLVNPIVSKKPAYRYAAFVIKLDPNGQHVLFSTYLGGQQASPRPLGIDVLSSIATTIAFDREGNAYVGGTTNETDFPTTPGALLSGKGGAYGFDQYSYAFLVKINPDGKLLYGTELATRTNTCFPPTSGCLGHQSTFGTVSGLLVDDNGAATVALKTGAAVGIEHDYVARLAPDGSRWLWTANLPLSSSESTRVVTDLRIATEGGDVEVFGVSAEAYGGGDRVPTSYRNQGLFAAQLKGDGSGWNYQQDLGRANDSAVRGMVLDAAGHVFLAGRQNGSDQLWALDTASGTLHAPLVFSRDTILAAPGMDGDNVLLIGAQGALLTVPADYHGESPAIVGFGSAASFTLNTGVYPGALISLVGFDLPGAADGLQVMFDGRPAPVFYAGPQKITAQVPFWQTDSQEYTRIKVTWQSGEIDIVVKVTQSIGLFTVDGTHAAAMNQDGSVNSSDNPAPAGSIVSLFGTGAVWPEWAKEGIVATLAMPLDQQVNRFLVTDWTSSPVNVWYAGTAPGSAIGVFQINVQLPSVAPAGGAGSFRLQSSPFGQPIYSNAAVVYVR